MTRDCTYVTDPEQLDILAGILVDRPDIDIETLEEAERILMEKAINGESDFVGLMKEYANGQPTIPPDVYHPKPPDDDTPQWIWDHWHNGGCTS